jgi:hypothetical protein
MRGPALPFNNRQRGDPARLRTCLVAGCRFDARTGGLAEPPGSASWGPDRSIGAAFRHGQGWVIYSTAFTTFLSFFLWRPARAMAKTFRASGLVQRVVVESGFGLVEEK